MYSCEYEGVKGVSRVAVYSVVCAEDGDGLATVLDKDAAEAVECVHARPDDVVRHHVMSECVDE